MLKQEFAVYDNFFFDFDGVIWEGEEALPGAPELIRTLQTLGKKVYFLSNNTTRTRESFTEKLGQLGIETTSPQILSTSFSVACFLQSKYPPGTKVFTIGLLGLPEEVSNAGFTVVNSMDMIEETVTSSEDYLRMPIDSDVKVVIVGFTPFLNYYMIGYAVRCVQNGAELIAGNGDKYDKVGDFNIPSSGCTVAAIEVCTGAKASTVGKPNTYMLKLAMDRDHLDRSKSIVFGDKMDTDILLAKNYGVASVLMLTGVDSRITAANYTYQPDFILSSLFDVLQTRDKL